MVPSRRWYAHRGQLRIRVPQLQCRTRYGIYMHTVKVKGLILTVTIIIIIIMLLFLLLTGFWGAYSSFSKHGRATFGFISFTFLSILLDVVFCAINSHRASVFEFCLTMFIICMLLKVYALYQSSLFFTSIGGAYSLESSKLTTSMYESLSKSITSAATVVLCISDTVGCGVCSSCVQ